MPSSFRGRLVRTACRSVNAEKLVLKQVDPRTPACPSLMTGIGRTVNVHCAFYLRNAAVAVCYNGCFHAFAPCVSGSFQIRISHFAAVMRKQLFLYALRFPVQILFMNRYPKKHFNTFRLTMKISHISMQRLCGTHLRTSVAEDAFRSVFRLAGFPVDLHIHGAGSQTFPAMDALLLVAVDAEQRKVTHGLEKNRNGTKILAERAVILKATVEQCPQGNRVLPARNSQNMICSRCATFIRNSPDTNAREYRATSQERRTSVFPYAAAGAAVGAKVQRQSRPAGVAAPAAPEQQRARLCHREG